MTRFHHLPRRVVLVMALGALSACSQAADPADAVSLTQAHEAHQAGQAVLIDIREPHEHAQGVAQGARLLPMSQLAERLAEVPTDESKPVYLICATQNRSRASLKALRERGAYGHVRYVGGGMTGWVWQGLPTVLPFRKF